MLAWTKAVVSKHGPPKSTTRHILLTLATHMNGDGTSCYPSQERLATETCMCHVPIYRHLKIAENLGWIARWQQKEGGRKWALTYYEATFPSNVPAEEFDAPWLVDPNWQKSEGPKRRYPPVASSGTKPGYVPQDQGTKPRASGHETSGNEARNDVREVRNGDPHSTKRRFDKGSTEGSKEGSNGGRTLEGAGASASTSTRALTQDQIDERYGKACEVLDALGTPYDISIAAKIAGISRAQAVKARARRTSEAART